MKKGLMDMDNSVVSVGGGGMGGGGYGIRGKMVIEEHSKTNF